MNTTKIAEKPIGFSHICTPLFTLFVVFILWDGLVPWQRILFSLALLLPYGPRITGYDRKNRNQVWLEKSL